MPYNRWDTPRAWLKDALGHSVTARDVLAELLARMTDDEICQTWWQEMARDQYPNPPKPQEH